MDFQGRICLPIIDMIEQDEFVLLDAYYVDISNVEIFIVHIPWHFFLSKVIDL